MKCNELTQDLLADLRLSADELDAGLRARAEAHVAACPACRARAANLEALAGALRSKDFLSDGPAVAAATDAAVLRDIDALLGAPAPSATSPMLISVMRIAAAAALVLICLAFGAFYLVHWQGLKKSNSRNLARDAKQVHPQQGTPVPDPHQPVLIGDGEVRDIFENDKPRRIVFDDDIARPLFEDDPARRLIHDTDADLSDILRGEDSPDPLRVIVDPGEDDTASVDPLHPDTQPIESPSVKGLVSPENAAVAFGDINADGRADAADAPLLCALLVDPGATLRKQDDVNRDGVVDVIDALLLAKNNAAR